MTTKKANPSPQDLAKQIHDGILPIRLKIEAAPRQLTKVKRLVEPP